MRPSLRTLAPAGLLALALLVSACGVEAGDQLSTDAPGTSAGTSETTTSTTAERTPQEQKTYETLRKTYRDLGFSEKEAACVADKVSAMADSSGLTNPADAAGLINDCGISTTRLNEIMQGMGNGSVDDAMRNALVAGFRNSGLSEKQATCMGDAYVDEFGSDPSAAGDPSKLQSLFTTCDVDPGDFKPGN